LKLTTDDTVRFILVIRDIRGSDRFRPDLLMCGQTHSVQTLSVVPYVLPLLLETWPSKLNQRKPTARPRKLEAVLNRVLSHGRALPERQQFIAFFFAFKWQSLCVDKVQMMATLSLSLSRTTRKPVIYE